VWSSFGWWGGGSGANNCSCPCVLLIIVNIVKGFLFTIAWYWLEENFCTVIVWEFSLQRFRLCIMQFPKSEDACSYNEDFVMRGCHLSFDS
jgi:hypothetical protein